MKKLIIACLFIINASISYANINIDPNFAYTDTTDLKIMPGFGFTLSMDIHKDFNLFTRTLVQNQTYNPKTNNSHDNSYVMSVIGVQYLFQISDLPVFWTNSLGTGLGKAEFKPNDTITGNVHKSESGICAVYWTGLLWNATQFISPYLEVGYHKSFYFNDFKNNNISGIQVVFGVRFTIGRNKDLYKDY